MADPPQPQKLWEGGISLPPVSVVLGEANELPTIDERVALARADESQANGPRVLLVTGTAVSSTVRPITPEERAAIGPGMVNYVTIEHVTDVTPLCATKVGSIPTELDFVHEGGDPAGRASYEPVLVPGRSYLLLLRERSGLIYLKGGRSDVAGQKQGRLQQQSSGVGVDINHLKAGCP